MTVNEVALTPPKRTIVAPVKFVPVIVTVAPVAAEVGVNEVIVGAGMKVNPVFEPVPTEVVTEMLPDAPFPTLAVIWVALFIVKEVAFTPPNLTLVAPVKLVPVITTLTPCLADVGVKEEIVGVGLL